MDEKYKNAIYLVNIEGLSYKEVSKILDLTLSNAKVLVHRGKKELKKILLKKGFKEMRKISRISIIVICILIGLSGVTFGAITIYNNFIKKQDSFETNGLYSDGRGYTNYETDLTANDMTWQSNVNLYYRVITNIDDYNKYKTGDEIIIHDINYSDGIYYDYSGAQGTEKDLLYYNTSKELRKTILKNGEYEDIFYNFYKHNEFYESYSLITIQNWVTDEFINNQ